MFLRWTVKLGLLPFSMLSTSGPSYREKIELVGEQIHESRICRHNIFKATAYCRYRGGTLLSNAPLSWGFLSGTWFGEIVEERSLFLREIVEQCSSHFCWNAELRFFPYSMLSRSGPSYREKIQMVGEQFHDFPTCRHSIFKVTADADTEDGHC